MSWIKVSESKPLIGQMVMVWDSRCQNACVVTVTSDNWHADLTHWQPFTVEPQLRDLTQADKDAEAFKRDALEYNYSSSGSEYFVWQRALAYERSEIAKLLGDTPIHTAVNFSKLIDRVRGGAA